MTARRPLLPYALLLVAPAVVLAAIGWRSVGVESRARHDEARRRAETEARRIVEEEADHLEALRVREDRRPYFQYQPKYMPEDAVSLNGTAFVDSPLTRPPDDPRILGWFQWTLSLGVIAGPDVFAPDPKRVDEILKIGWSDWARALLAGAPRDPLVATAPVQRFPVQTVAANEEAGQLLEEVGVANATNKSTNYLDNFRARVQQRQTEAGPSAPPDERIEVRSTPVRYRLVKDAPFVVAWRLVWIPATAATQRGAPRDRWLVQGYLLDAERFFGFDFSTQVAGVRVVHGPRWVCGNGSSDECRTDDDVSVSLVEHLDVGDQRRDVPRSWKGQQSEWPRLGVVAVPDQTALGGEDRASALRYLLILGGLAAVVGVGLFVLLRSVRREVALAERKQDFVAAVTHELKTPLAGIRMYADMLKEGWVPDGESVSDYAGRIGSETQRLSSLVDQILDLAALERGVATVNAMPADLAAVVRAAVDAAKPAAEAAGVPVRLDAEQGLPPVLLDATLVRPLVTNLLDNAIKYSALSDTKDVLVTVRRAAGGVKPAAVEVVVADRGVGIAKEDQARLFQPFSRGGREETRTARGVGLGLALVKRYADAHKAKVTLESAVGRGTTVSVRFPAADPAA